MDRAARVTYGLYARIRRHGNWDMVNHAPPRFHKERKGTLKVTHTTTPITLRVAVSPSHTINCSVSSTEKGIGKEVKFIIPPKDTKEREFYLTRPSEIDATQKVTIYFSAEGKPEQVLKEWTLSSTSNHKYESSKTGKKNNEANAIPLILTLKNRNSITPAVQNIVQPIIPPKTTKMNKVNKRISPAFKEVTPIAKKHAKSLPLPLPLPFIQNLPPPTKVSVPLFPNVTNTKNPSPILPLSSQVLPNSLFPPLNLNASSISLAKSAVIPQIQSPECNFLKDDYSANLSTVMDGLLNEIAENPDHALLAAATPQIAAANKSTTGWKKRALEPLSTEDFTEPPQKKAKLLDEREQFIADVLGLSSPPLCQDLDSSVLNSPPLCQDLDGSVLNSPLLTLEKSTETHCTEASDLDINDLSKKRLEQEYLENGSNQFTSKEMGSSLLEIMTCNFIDQVAPPDTIISTSNINTDPYQFDMPPIDYDFTTCLSDFAFPELPPVPFQDFI